MFLPISQRGAPQKCRQCDETIRTFHRPSGELNVSPEELDAGFFLEFPADQFIPFA